MAHVQPFSDVVYMFAAQITDDDVVAARREHNLVRKLVGPSQVVSTSARMPAATIIAECNWKDWPWQWQ